MQFTIGSACLQSRLGLFWTTGAKGAGENASSACMHCGSEGAACMHPIGLDLPRKAQIEE
jgi:hypothetical protein